MGLLLSFAAVMTAITAFAIVFMRKYAKSGLIDMKPVKTRFVRMSKSDSEE